MTICTKEFGGKGCIMLCMSNIPVYSLSPPEHVYDFYSCDESVSRGRKTGTKGRKTGTKGRETGTKERGNEKPYGLVQIEYLDQGTSPRHVWTWRGRVTPFLDV